MFVEKQVNYIIGVISMQIWAICYKKIHIALIALKLCL